MVVSVNELLKVFGTMKHELVMAKLYMYRFFIDALKLIFSYMSDHRNLF